MYDGPLASGVAWHHLRPVMTHQRKPPGPAPQTARVYDIAAATLQGTFAAGAPVLDATFENEGVVYTGGLDGTVKRWVAAAGAAWGAASGGVALVPRPAPARTAARAAALPAAVLPVAVPFRLPLGGSTACAAAAWIGLRGRRLPLSTPVPLLASMRLPSLSAQAPSPAPHAPNPQL